MSFVCQFTVMPKSSSGSDQGDGLRSVQHVFGLTFNVMPKSSSSADQGWFNKCAA